MNLAHNILRFGLGLTFVWVGFMILQDPVAWGSFVKPWAQDLVPGSMEAFMKGVGIADIAIGGLLALGFWVRIAALLASIHLVLILVTSGIDSVTVRDIGLLGATLALAIWPTPKQRRAKEIDENMQEMRKGENKDEKEVSSS